MFLLSFNSIRLISKSGLLLGIVLAAPVLGEPRSCEDSLFIVDAEEADLASVVCEVLPQLRDQLEACGLHQARRVTVEIVERIDHPLGSCLAYFDCDYDLIRITEPKKYRDLTADDAVYSRFPEEVTLRSLLAHELTHALVTQTAAARQIDMVDQEYIAGAMELELMEPKWREVYLEAAATDAPPSPSLIDIWIYGFTPRSFAANAWRHFRRPENGCNLVQKIVAGEESFSKSARPELR